MKENKFIATKYDKEWEKETLKFDYHGEKGLDQKPPFLSCVFIKKGGVWSWTCKNTFHFGIYIYTHVRMRDWI